MKTCYHIGEKHDTSEEFSLQSALLPHVYHQHCLKQSYH